MNQWLVAAVGDLDATLNFQKAVAQLIKKLNDWAIMSIKMLPNLVVAVIVLIIIIRLRHPLSRLASRAVLRVTGHRHISRLMGTLTRLAVIAVGIILAMDVLNLDRAVASLLAGVGILGIALGFASQDIAANFMAGIVLHFEHPFRIGDRIKTGDFLGYIDSMSLRSTIIRGRQGERITVPNKNLLGTPITNYYISGVRRIDLYIGIDYMPDLQLVEDLAVKAVESLQPPLRDLERPVEFFYEEVKDTTIIFRIRFWTDTEQPVYLRAKSQAIKAINQIFKDHGIARPSTVVTLDFGMTGGGSLREQFEGLGLPLALPEGKQTGKRSDQQEE